MYLSHYMLRRLRRRPFLSANSRPFCSPEVILTLLHVLNICTFYYDSRRYFSYIVRCPSSHCWLYATLISSLKMMMTNCFWEFHHIYNWSPVSDKYEQIRFWCEMSWSRHLFTNTPFQQSHTSWWFVIKDHLVLYKLACNIRSSNFPFFLFAFTFKFWSHKEAPSIHP